MEPQPALGRTARRVVLHPEAREHADGAVVQLGREADRVLAMAASEDIAQLGLEAEVRCRRLELLDCGSEGAATGRTPCRGRLDRHRVAPCARGGGVIADSLEHGREHGA